jgi:RNA polymerase sigma-70 factor (ECF subfamily)
MQQEPVSVQPYTANGEIIFEQVFKDHFKSLHAYAYTIIKDDIMAEEMVQNVFFKLWEKKENIQVQQSLAAYLYRSVYNECLNYIKHQKVRAAHQVYVQKTGTESQDAADNANMKDLEKRLAEALNDLPEQCRTIFQMSRFEELKYREIADKLGIAVKTVENQMGKALKILRLKLVDFLILIILFILKNFIS